MANPEHVEIARQGDESIADWLIENPNSRFNLLGADLRGVDLRHAVLGRADSSNSPVDLRSADLRDADLRNANFFRTILRRADLRGADLRGIDLRRADLRNAVLRNANLGSACLLGADLSRVDLSNADLSGANLHEADLNGANLREANLSRANLREANLIGASLTRAKLAHTNFNNARLFRTIFSFTDLRQTQGLNTCVHRGPSEIGFHTLEISDGKAPEVFLRGCGLSDDVIAYVPELFGNSIDFYSCFISYSQKDKKFAKLLHDTLQGRGIRCWLDEKQLLPGDQIHESITHGIRVWDKLLLCSSETSLTSWWVDKEVTTAFQKEEQLFKSQGQKKLVLIPLNLDGHLFKDDFEWGWKSDVTSRVAADFTNWKRNHDKFEEQVELVIKALRTDGGRLPDPVPKL